MRWKINSISYGPRVLTLIVILTVVVPLILYVFYAILDRLGLTLPILPIAITAFLAAGLILLVLFVLLLAVEFTQDHLLNKYYRENRNKKIKISEEYYECQACGNRLVREADRICGVCGQKLI